MKTIIIVLLAMMIALWYSHTDASMEKVRLEQLASRSHTIVIGRVVEVRSDFADLDRKEIVTYVTIAPTDVLKGASGPTLVLTIPGGVVGDLGLWVEDTPQFLVGEEVLLFVNDDYKGRKTVSEWRQGKFPIINGGTFVDGFEVSIQDFINGIRAFISRGQTGEIQLERRKPSPHKTREPRMGLEAVPSISYITPSSGPAIRPYAINPNDPFNPGDRGRIIDIYGSGFGSTQGTSVVRFYENQFSSPPIIADAEDYLLWSDTRITCKVPGRQLSGNKFLNASSGSVYVITSGGTSNGVQFTVTFAMSSKWFPSMPVTYYINQNGTPDADGEFQAIQDAFQTWENVSNSRLDYMYAGTTSRVAVPYQTDNYNDCRWIESDWPFQSSSIAVNVFYFNGNPQSTIALEFDIYFNGDTYLWSTTGQSGRMDVQNIATHESGHSLNLQDIYGIADAAKTMYGNSSTGETSKQTLEADDIAGCRYIQPDQYSLTVNNNFYYHPGASGQINVKNISQGTNTVPYSTPLNQTIRYGTEFRITAPGQNVNGVDYIFSHWDDGDLNNFKTFSSNQSLSFTANYKGHFMSNVPTALTHNGGRKIWATNGTGAKYYVVYEDNGDIYLTKYIYYAESGWEWTDEQLISDGSGNSAYPCIAANNNGSEFCIVWQKFEPSTNYYSIIYRSTEDWLNPVTLTSECTSPISRPVVGVTGSFYWTYVYYWMFVWDNGDGLKYFDTYSYQIIDIPETDETCHNVTITNDPPGTQGENGIAWQSDGDIYFVQFSTFSTPEYSTPVNLTSEYLYFDNSQTPSIAIDYGANGEIMLTWFAETNLEVEPPPPIEGMLGGLNQGTISSITRKDIYCRKKQIYGSWDPPTQIILENYHSIIPVVGSVGENFVLLWKAQNNDFLARLDYIYGSGWGKDIETYPGESITCPSITTSANEIAAVWSLYDAAPYQIHYEELEEPQEQVKIEDNKTVKYIYRTASLDLSKIKPAWSGSLTFVMSHLVNRTKHSLIPFSPDSLYPVKYLASDRFNSSSKEEEIRFKIWIYGNDVGTIKLGDDIGNFYFRILLRVFGPENQSHIVSKNVCEVIIPDETSKEWFSKIFEEEITLNLKNLVGKELEIETEIFPAYSLNQSPAYSEILKFENVNSKETINDKKLFTDSEPQILPINKFELYTAYPNPFNPSTIISFDLAEKSGVSLEIFDITGRKICTLVNEIKEAGTYQVIWNGQDDYGKKVASGLYVYRIEAGNFIQSKKLLFMK